MTSKFSFVYKGFEIDVEVTHNGESVSVKADVTHPDLPPPDEIMAMIFAVISKRTTK